MVSKNQLYEKVDGIEYFVADDVTSLKLEINRKWGEGKNLVVIAALISVSPETTLKFARSAMGEVPTTIIADMEYTGPSILYGLFAVARLANELPIVAINVSPDAHNLLQHAFAGYVRFIPRAWKYLEELAESIKAVTISA